MRYLKYNEELKPTTYKSAADKLAKLGHHTRASILHKHSEDTVNKNAIVNWEKQVETYSKYGKIKVLIEKDGDKSFEASEEEVYFCFYPYLEPYKDDTRFLTSTDPRSIKVNELGWTIEAASIYFEMWLIPQTREQFDRMNDLLQPDYYEPQFGFQTHTFYISLELEPNHFEFNEVKNNFYYNDGSFTAGTKVFLADRPSAGRIKILLKKFFADSSLQYPVPFEDKTMYRTLLSQVLAEPGISTECGIGMEDFAEYIATINPNSFFKQ
jgi:hypothetical protein